MPQTETMYTAQVTTREGGLRLRSGPGKAYPSIFSIPKGALVEVLTEYETGWAFVRYSGKTGYASMEFLTAKEPEPETPKQEEPAMAWGVFVGNMDRERAEALAAQYPGAILTAYRAGQND